MYAILLVLAGGGALLLNKSYRYDKASLYFFIYCLTWIIIFVTIGFRAESIGADTCNYLSKYKLIKTCSSYSEYGGTSEGEPIFFYINKLLSIIFGDWDQSIILFEGLAVAIVYSVIIRKYSEDPILTTLAFLSLGLYLTSLCILRQFIAMSICLVSLRYVYEKKRIGFIICLIIATLVHYSAMFWGVVYIFHNELSSIKRKEPYYLLLAIFAYFYVGVFQDITSGILDRWSAYSAIESGAEGYITFSIFALITLLIYANKKTIIANNKYASMFMDINYISMILWAMRLVTRNTERITLYFTIAPIVLLPSLCTAISKRYGKGMGSAFRFVVIVLLMVFFYYKYSKDPHYSPYVFASF